MRHFSIADPAILVGLFLFALALRCYGLDQPLLDTHSWRQADTAAIARNFVDSGRFSHPQVDWGGATAGYVESEFPLYTGALALLFGAFGPHEWLGRLLTALLGAATPPALYALVRQQAGSAFQRRAALYAALTLCVLPFPVYFGRAVMPDTLMLLAATLAIWSFQRWVATPAVGAAVGAFRETPRPLPLPLLLALLCGALAPLAKTPNLIIVGVPLVYLALRHRAWQRWPQLLVYTACFALPVLLWTRHAATLPEDPRQSFGIGEKLFDLRLLADPGFYALVGRWAAHDVLTWIGCAFALIGMIATVRLDRAVIPGEAFASGFTFEPDQSRGLARSHAPRSMVANASPLRGGTQSPGHLVTLSSCHLLSSWLVGVLAFVLVGAAGVVGQDYYLLPLAGPGAWLIGLGIVRAQVLAARWRLVAAALPAAALLLIAAFSLARIAPMYQTADFYGQLGRRLDLALPKGQRVGVIAPAVSELLYYSGRKGWRLDPGVLVPGGLASLGPDLGVRYVLIADPWLSQRHDLLAAELQAFRRVPVGPYALLLDLQQPGYADEFELVWQTGHVVEGRFLERWRALGGSQALGFPISDALAAAEGRTQYFERAVLLEAGGVVELAPAGSELLELRGQVRTPAPVEGAFAEAWAAAGGELALGAAISPVVGGVQLFERGALEQRADGSIGLGAVGRWLLEARGLDEETQISMAYQE
ncbi:MAG: phospholipid carrier-dependent glycosyltransferase [Roseiflexaceae bacterium]|nr:phospholipid carrier-dependent glycosyltransferase [Roseiflexaceae bacterium]